MDLAVTTIITSKQEGGGSSDGKNARKFERPSERRRRLEREATGDGPGGYNDYNEQAGGEDDAFANFGGYDKRRSQGDGGGSGRGGGGFNKDDRGYDNSRDGYNNRDNRGYDDGGFGR